MRLEDKETYNMRILGMAAAVVLMAASMCAAAEDVRPQAMKDAGVTFTGPSIAATVAGIVGKKETLQPEVDWRTTQYWRTVKVTEVLWGDAETKELWIEDKLIKAAEGDRVLVVYVGKNYYGGGIVVPDKPEYRQAIAAEIAANRRKQAEKVDNDFLDRKAMLDQAEGLLRGFLKEVAEQVPDHPDLGRKAIESVKVVRTPEGVYVRIVHNAVWLPTQAIVPKKDGIVLWMGLGLEGDPPGNPETLADPGRLGVARVTSDEYSPILNKADTWRDEIAWFPGPQSLSLMANAKMNESDIQAPVRHALHQASLAFKDKIKAINTDPPRDLDAAIDYLAAHAKALANPAPPAKGAPPATDNFGVDHRLAGALRAVGTGHDGSVAPAPARKYTPQQFRRLVPVLIELLTDSTCVYNMVACDGPIIGCHQEVYPLLVKITGQDLPSPLSQKLEGGMQMPQPAAPATPGWADPLKNIEPLKRRLDAAKADREKADQQDRLEAWRDWWKKQAEKASPK
jgi:hypothetical protein